MPRLSPLSLEGLRACVRPEYAAMEAADLEQVVEDAVSGIAEDSAESVMNTLGSLGKAVAPTLQRAAPGIAQGAASGAAVGGPWGALIGAGAGLTSAALSGKRGPAAMKAAPAAEIPALPSGQGAAATLLDLMRHPAVQQAILSQVMGPAGTQQIATPTGTQVPRGAINNLLMQLLANASEALDESESVDDESYLRNEAGEYVADPASPEQQAAVVLAHLGQAASPEIADDTESAEVQFESVEFY
jgi:hypothetical protein